MSPRRMTALDADGRVMLNEVAFSRHSERQIIDMFASTFAKCVTVTALSYADNLAESFPQGDRHPDPVVPVVVWRRDAP